MGSASRGVLVGNQGAKLASMKCAVAHISEPVRLAFSAVSGAPNCPHESREALCGVLYGELQAPGGSACEQLRQTVVRLTGILVGFHRGPAVSSAGMRGMQHSFGVVPSPSSHTAPVTVCLTV